MIRNIFKCPHCGTLDSFAPEAAGRESLPPCYACGTELMRFERVADPAFMDVGTALEIVHGMATRAFRETSYAVPEVCAEAKLALDTVEDFIVNNFGEEN